MRLTIKERVLVVKTFYCHDESYAKIVRNLRRIMSRTRCLISQQFKINRKHFTATHGGELTNDIFKQKSNRSTCKTKINGQFKSDGFTFIIIIIINTKPTSKNCNILYIYRLKAIINYNN